MVLTPTTNDRPTYKPHFLGCCDRRIRDYRDAASVQKQLSLRAADAWPAELETKDP